jgi:hypothetical protein
MAGSSANAFIHNPESTNGQGKWEPNWTAIIADGKDNYIGSTKPDAQDMSGFAINIGSGQICQNIRFDGSTDWGKEVCAKQRNAFNFGGTVDNDRFLEAVWFTVMDVPPAS